MELATASTSQSRSGSLTVHINKVSSVKTINLVAKELGESEDWLYDVAAEMETEDGLIRVYGIGEDSVMAFTDFGIESLIELIQIHKHNATLLKREDDAK